MKSASTAVRSSQESTESLLSVASVFWKGKCAPVCGSGSDLLPLATRSNSCQISCLCRNMCFLRGNRQVEKQRCATALRRTAATRMFPIPCLPKLTPQTRSLSEFNSPWIIDQTQKRSLACANAHDVLSFQIAAKEPHERPRPKTGASSRLELADAIKRE